MHCPISDPIAIKFAKSRGFRRHIMNVILLFVCSNNIFVFTCNFPVCEPSTSEDRMVIARINGSCRFLANAWEWNRKARRFINQGVIPRHWSRKMKSMFCAKIFSRTHSVNVKCKPFYRLLRCVPILTKTATNFLLYREYDAINFGKPIDDLTR